MNINNIKDPLFLKNLTTSQLKQLSTDIRQFLIEQCSITGGHISSNLGIVELTIALHKFFDSPTDKFIFDVGHQSYVHKILTGRAQDFNKLRQYQGMSGFPKRKESIHDQWETGHSSTSLSAAMGMAKARDMLGGNYEVIPIIGDGALTGGMAFEALNHIGHDRTKMTIILNDNQMSITPNVGAMHHMLTRLRSTNNYLNAKLKLEKILHNIPSIGNRMFSVANRVKDSMKYLLVKGVLFEELGLKYIGPIDGHNFDSLDQAFESAKNFNQPVIIHVITTKGKGYLPAETDKRGIWHGCGPYKIETGESVTLSKQQTKAWSSVVSDELIEMARKDDKIVVVSPAMLLGSKLEKFQMLFPKRIFDVGIAEQHAVTFAGGLASQNFKPVVSIYSTFLQRAIDQVIHDIAIQKLNVLFCIDRAGLVGEDGETHQGVFDIALLRPIPNISIIQGKDMLETRQLLHLANKHEGAVALRIPRGATTIQENELLDNSIEWGSWEYLKHGKDVVILTFGPMLEIATEVAVYLAKSDISVAVINCRFIKPIDKVIMNELLANKVPIVAIEEAILSGGFTSAIAEYIIDNKGQNKLLRLGIDDMFVEQGNCHQLLDQIGLTIDKIQENIKQFLNE